MSLETMHPYSERIATVVGGAGQLGSRIENALRSIGLKDVRVCEKGDPFTEFLRESTDVFFAIDGAQTKDMLQASREFLRPDHTILDGASVKTPLIPLYRELDSIGLSICLTHLGAVPVQPWRGVKVWLCEVGSNSEKGIRLARDTFLTKNCSIRVISIEDHQKVERDQWLTFAAMETFTDTLRRIGLPLAEFNEYATLNAELLSLPAGRTLGQGEVIPSEILYGQPKKQVLLAAMRASLEEFEGALSDRVKLEKYIRRNIEFHDNPSGFIKSVFKKAGVVGARNANLRMYSFSFRITDDKPGKLIELLIPFDREGVNITALDSMPGTATKEEEQQGVDPDEIVDFDIGLDPKTITPEKETRLTSVLEKMGCVVVTNKFPV